MSKNNPQKQAHLATSELAASSCRNQTNPVAVATDESIEPVVVVVVDAAPASASDFDSFSSTSTSTAAPNDSTATKSSDSSADETQVAAAEPPKEQLPHNSDESKPSPPLVAAAAALEANRNSRASAGEVRLPAKNEKFDQQLSIDLINPNNLANRNVSLIERLRFMYLNETLSDVVFVCGADEAKAERIPALRAILSAGSPVFMSMFYGAGSQMQGQAESEIVLPDIEPESFRIMLRYLYTDELCIEADSVMSTLYVAKKYAIIELESKCVEFLKSNLRSDNAFMLLQQARLFDELQLADLCLDVIDKHSCEAFESDCFKEIDLETLVMIVKRDTLGIREFKLYEYVLKWAQNQCALAKLEPTRKNYQLVLGETINHIRFPLMTKEELAVVVDDEDSRLIDDDSIIQLFVRLILAKNPAGGSGNVNSNHNNNNNNSVSAEPTVVAIASIARTLKFVDTPRSCLNGKEHSVNRFTQIESRWGYSGTSDRIRFKVDRKIFVVGFGLYGSIYPQSPYTCNIQLIHFDSCTTCAQTSTNFVCDGSNNVIRVFFKEPVEVQPDQEYIASSTLKGSDSYYGTKGLRKVLHETQHTDSVTFTFQSASGNNNGTSVEDGQIPEIIFLYSC